MYLLYLKFKVIDRYFSQNYYIRYRKSEKSPFNDDAIQVWCKPLECYFIDKQYCEHAVIYSIHFSGKYLSASYLLLVDSLIDLYRLCFTLNIRKCLWNLWVKGKLHSQVVNHVQTDVPTNYYLNHDNKDSMLLKSVKTLMSETKTVSNTSWMSFVEEQKKFTNIKRGVTE